ncbi:hypothetical protein PTKIN_Ptkin03bG0064700 [Pterospermum kingtungense]
MTAVVELLGIPSIVWCFDSCCTPGSRNMRFPFSEERKTPRAKNTLRGSGGAGGTRVQNSFQNITSKLLNFHRIFLQYQEKWSFQLRQKPELLFWNAWEGPIEVASSK